MQLIDVIKIQVNWKTLFIFFGYVFLCVFWIQFCKISPVVSCKQIWSILGKKNIVWPKFKLWTTYLGWKLPIITTVIIDFH